MPTGHAPGGIGCPDTGCAALREVAQLGALPPAVSVLHAQARLVACHILRHLGKEEGKPRSISLDEIFATHVLDGQRVLDLGPASSITGAFAAAAVSAAAAFMVVHKQQGGSAHCPWNVHGLSVHVCMSRLGCWAAAEGLVWCLRCFPMCSALKLLSCLECCWAAMS
jgi:hypothetical protein